MPNETNKIDATISFIMLEQCIAAALEAIEDDNCQEAVSELHEAEMHVENLRPQFETESK